jgi:acetyltransferase-like isoleucine patch superfamily enzyme
MFQRIVQYLFFRSSKEKEFRRLSEDSKVGQGLIIQFPTSRNLQLGKSLDLRNYISIWVGKNAVLKIGNNVFINNYCSINCLKEIEIGENTLFGEGVKIYDHNHQYLYENDQLTVSSKEFSLDAIKIGKNCWLGSNVVVLKGVTIGDNSIIGAGCVIHKDVPENSVIVNQQNLINKMT